MSEFHSILSPSGIYMLRDSRWKYVYYYGYPPQLFDMLNDPDEQQDLANDTQYANVLAECEVNLRDMIDIDATEQRARAFQAAKVTQYGGIDAIRECEIKHTYTPPPVES